MEDILEKLRDLQIQATTERSHYYVRKTCEEAIQEIQQLRADAESYKRWAHEIRIGVAELKAEIKRLKEYEWKYNESCLSGCHTQTLKATRC